MNSPHLDDASNIDYLEKSRNGKTVSFDWFWLLMHELAEVEETRMGRLYQEIREGGLHLQC